MAGVNAVWGIDVGQCALKALRMQMSGDGTMEVTHFDLIDHPKILSQPDANADELIRNALDKFLSRNDITGARVAVSVPGQSSFAKFIKLPPVEPKRIPKIVEFEAAQQIPFDIDEVEWDYQTFISPNSPDVEVGLFAMRKEQVIRSLSNFISQGIQVDIVQLTPLALYNMLSFDELASRDGATVIVDVGASSTDLVVSDGERIWLRPIPLGGNNFTEALVKAFKLPFSKAESLKRSAATNKYARQIFVAMRPVFGDLLSEIQRSLGFYTSMNRDSQIKRIVCLGNAFRLPGLQRYLEQNLQVEVVQVHGFKRLKPSATINAPSFTENLLSFGVAYGLGIQGLEQGPIRSNLLPFSIIRQRNWRSQKPWAGAAAAAMVVGVALSAWVAGSRSASLAQETLAPDSAYRKANEVFKKHQEIQAKANRLRGQGDAQIREIKETMRIIGYRNVVMQTLDAISRSVPDWQGQVVKAYAAEKKLDPRTVNWSSKELRAWFAERRDNWGLDSRGQPSRADSLVIQFEEIDLEYWEGKPPAGRERDGRAGAAGANAGGGAPQAAASGEFGAKAGNRPVQAHQPVPQGGAQQQRGFRVTAVGLINQPATHVPDLVRDQVLGTLLERIKGVADVQFGQEQLNAALERGLHYDRVSGPGGAPSRDPMGLANPDDIRFTLAFDVLVTVPPASSPAGAAASGQGRAALPYDEGDF